MNKANSAVFDQATETTLAEAQEHASELWGKKLLASRVERVRAMRDLGATLEQVGEAMGSTRHRASTWWKKHTGTGWKDA